MALALSQGTLFAQRFTVEKLAGSGGMGSVYRAVDCYTGKDVALKLLHAGDGSFKDTDRFAREAQILSELRHPNIVTYIAHGQTPDGQRYLAMEWLEGADLAAYLKRGPLPIDDCLRLLQSVTDGIAAAHEKSIVHRDLKPTNLFLPNCDLNQVKILDFGTARRSRGMQPMTRTGMIVGTPEYMAPEQARGVREITTAADIFALGCVAYECLTGQPPFFAEHIAAVLVRILFEEPPPLIERRPGLPDEICQLVQRMLRKDPAQRFLDAQALQESLKSLALISPGARETRQPSTAPPSLVMEGGEQAIFSIVLAQPPHKDTGDLHAPPSTGPKLAGATPDLTDAEYRKRQTLHRALDVMGIHTEILLDGALAATLSTFGSVSDQTTQAARVALLVKEHWPDATVVVATGRGMVRGRQPVGEVLSRALSLLDEKNLPGHHERNSGILIDALSAQLLAPNFRLTMLPSGALLLGEDHEVDESRPLLGKPTPCVGRELELGTLERELQACIDEDEARVVLVTAPPGYGKSRLRHEFFRRIAPLRPGIPVLLGRGELLSASAPYGIVAQALRRLAALSGSEPLDEQRARLSARLALQLGEQDPAEKQRIVEFLGEMIGVPLAAEPQPALLRARQDPKLLHEQLRRAFSEWLSAECKVAPILLVFDDFQWADALSVSLLDFTLRQLKNAPLFVLAFGRPEVRTVYPRLWQSHRLQELVLKGLSKRASERLIKQVLGNQVAPALVARITEQAAGNALYLEELIRITAEGSGQDQPETVLAMLQARLGRLSIDTRRVLHAASVFGQNFWKGGVARLLGCDQNAPELELYLRELIDVELIEPHPESQLSLDQEYGFRHSLMRDAAYALLTDQARVNTHAAAADYLHHHPEARGHLRSALAALDTLPAEPTTQAQHIELTLRLMSSSRTTDTPEEYIVRLQRAVEIAESRHKSDPTESHQEQLSLLHYWIGYCYYFSNQMAKALGHFQHVLQQPAKDERIMALPLGAMGRIQVFLGNFAKAAAMLERAVRIASNGGNLTEINIIQGFLGIALTACGRCTEGLAAAEQAVKSALDSDNIMAIPPARGPLAAVYCLRGEYQKSIAECDAGLALSREAGARVYSYLLYLIKAWAHGRAGRYEESCESYKECMSIRNALGGQVLAPDWLAMVRVEQVLLGSDLQTTIQVAEEALSTGRAQGGIFAQGIIHRLMARALLKGEDLAASRGEIRAHLNRSVALFEQGACHLERERTRVIEGIFFAQEKDWESAHTALKTAHDVMLTFGLPHEAAKIKSQLHALAIPYSSPDSGATH